MASSRDNASGFSPELHCSFHNDAVHITASSLYLLLFIPACMLNGLAVWVSLHLRSTSTFMVYLKNLVVADLLRTLTFPLEAVSHIPGAPDVLMGISCRYSAVIFYCSMYISIISLGLISLDRFFKIVRPWGRLLGQSLTFSRVLCGFIWGIYVCVNLIPTIILTNRLPDSHDGALTVNASITISGKAMSCVEMKNNAGKQWHTFLVTASAIIFWAICILITFCYICITMKVYQSNQNSGSSNGERSVRTKSRVFLILGVFLFCFAPFHVIRIPYTQHQMKQTTSCEVPLQAAKHMSLWLSATNVCLDPLIYFFLCRAFREKLYDLFKLGTAPT